MVGDRLGGADERRGARWADGGARRDAALERGAREPARPARQRLAIVVDECDQLGVRGARTDVARRRRPAPGVRNNRAAGRAPRASITASRSRDPSSTTMASSSISWRERAARQRPRLAGRSRVGMTTASSGRTRPILLEQPTFRPPPRLRLRGRPGQASVRRAALESARLKILVTNDDGIGAAGIHALRRALAELPDVDVRVIAPHTNRSGTARSITTHSPIWVEEVEFDDGTIGFATEGTPVDCVRFADLGLLGEQPDLIVSGINHGSNLGDDITYSGTVAAAFEGIILGVPGIAVSQQAEIGGMGYAGRRFEFGFAAAITREIVRRLIDGAARPGDAAQHQRPRGRGLGDRGDEPRQAPLQRRAEAGRGGRTRPATLLDLRLRALVQGRGGHRPRRRRPRPGRAHPDPLRPHRPRQHGPPGRLGSRRDRRRFRPPPRPRGQSRAGAG